MAGGVVRKIIATNETLRDIVEREIEKYGNDADLNHIDVSHVTNMCRMFACSDFNGDVGGWDVSHVTKMSEMFTGSKITGDIRNWRLLDEE